MHEIRAVLADDEPNLLRYLQEMLNRLWPELNIVGVAANGMEALGLVRDEEPDIVFLDIQMPVLTGLQVARRIQGECHVVFITAYDEYAIEAFDAAAVDYLLKPIEESRLLKSIERLKQLLNRPAAEASASLQQVLQQLAAQQHNVPLQYLSWIRAGEAEETHMVAVDEVIYFKAEDKYTSVMTADREYLIRKPIKELAGELDPDRFWQIHRATIVRLDQIAQLKKNLNGGYQLLLKDHPDELSVSRRYAHLFKQM